MVVAELEIYRSRSIAPTRRVALGDMNLPADPPPGFGGILLGGIVANFVGAIDADLLPDLMRLTTELEEGRRIAQPRLRYRFQHDKVGLQRSRHRLIGHGEELRFEFDEEHGLPAQQVLGAVYTAGRLDPELRPGVMSAIHRGIRWGDAVDGTLITALAGAGRGRPLSVLAFGNPRSWALDVLGFDDDDGGEVARPVVQRHFRDQLRSAHPDHGGDRDQAAQRIAELTEARRILLG